MNTPSFAIGAGPARRGFWIGALAVLLLGIPGAVLLRSHGRPALAEEHSHGDPKLEASLALAKGTDRLTLLRQSARDESPTKRLVVAESLVNERGAEMMALAKELLTDNDSDIRVKAAFAIAHSGQESDRPWIRATLRDSDTWVRLEIAQWAATNAGRRTGSVGYWLVPDLLACIDDPSESIRSLSIDALVKLTGKPWRYSVRFSDSERAAVIKKWKVWWQAQQAPQNPQPPLPDINPRRTDPTPTLSLKTIEGATVSPATSGKVTLINFWGTWCAPCLQEVPDLQRIHEYYGPHGVEVVGVALSEQNGASGLRAWCKKNGVTYAQSLAEDAITEAYGDIHEVPISVLVDKRGRIRYRWQGERDYAAFAAQVERLLKE